MPAEPMTVSASSPAITPTQTSATPEFAQIVTRFLVQNLVKARSRSDGECGATIRVSILSF